MKYIKKTELAIISKNSSFVKLVKKGLDKCTWITSKQFKSLELFLTSEILSRTIVLYDADGEDISDYELNLQKRLPELKLIRVNLGKIEAKPLITAIALTQKIIQNSIAYQERLN